MSKRLRPLAVVGIVRELRTGAGERRPIVVAGARELVPLLVRELRAGGDASAVVEGGSPQSASALVWLGPADEAALKPFARANVPIIAVTDEDRVPYVLATDLVRVPPGSGFPVDAIADAVARRLGEGGTVLAARLPVLRRAVVDHLIRSFARKNGIIGVAVFIPGADMPILTLNQIRLALRLAIAYGRPIDASRAPELLGVVGAGFGFRTIAREAVAFVPGLGWALKGAIAFGGTVAVGEAARRYFELRT